MWGGGGRVTPSIQVFLTTKFNWVENWTLRENGGLSNRFHVLIGERGEQLSMDGSQMFGRSCRSMFGTRATATDPIAALRVSVSSVCLAMVATGVGWQAN